MESDFGWSSASARMEKEISVRLQPLRYLGAEAGSTTQELYAGLEGLLHPLTTLSQMTAAPHLAKSTKV